ncbi:MAG TPA: hypothetical protein VGK13_05305 [Methanocellaceae archaeon]
MNKILIDDYINEVTKDMGSRQREDVGNELRAHILDSADAIAAEHKTEVDDVIIREVLAKMGPAEKVAAMYPAKKSLFMHGPVKALISLGGIALAFLMVAAILELVSPDVLNMPIPGSNSSQAILQVILSVVFSLALAIVVIAAIFLCMYIYQSQLKTPYEARLKSFEKSLHDIASPIKAVAMIIANLIWLAFMNLYWTQLPFVTSFTSNATLIPLLSDKFGPYMLYINAIGVANIIVAVLYLVVSQKWIPSLLEVLISLCNGLLFIWLIYVFPFNPAFSNDVMAMIKVIMAIIVVGCLIGTARQTWQTIRLAIFEKTGRNEAV